MFIIFLASSKRIRVLKYHYFPDSWRAFFFFFFSFWVLSIYEKNLSLKVYIYRMWWIRLKLHAFTWRCIILGNTDRHFTSNGIYWDSTEREVNGEKGETSPRLRNGRSGSCSGWSVTEMPENASFPSASFLTCSMTLRMSLPLAGLSFAIYKLRSFVWLRASFLIR